MNILSNFSKIKNKGPVKFKAKGGERQTISVWTPGGSDGCSTALAVADFLAESTQEKTVVVELPCLGIPRLAIHVNQYDKEKNTDKFLLDFERSEYTDVFPARYLLSVSPLVSVMANNPYATSDLPINLRLNNLLTLTDFPHYLKNNLLLEGYKHLIFILQGQLHHPLTFFAIKESAKVVFNVNFPIELGWCLSCYKKLMESYSEKEEKFFLYSSVLDTKTVTNITTMQYLKGWEELFS